MTSALQANTDCNYTAIHFSWALLNISDVEIWDDGRYEFFCPEPGRDSIREEEDEARIVH